MPNKDGKTVLLLSDNVWNVHGKHITSVAPGVSPLVYEGNEPFPDDILDTIDIAFFSSDCWPERTRGIILSIMNARNLKWLQTFSAGVDSPFFVQLMDRGVTLTNSSGATASPIAQTAMLYMLALSRDMRTWMHNQDKKRWQQHKIDELDGASLAVVGMGPIGMEIARLGVAMNMKVEAVRRSVKGDEPCPTFPMAELHDVLSRAEWVASALPLTPDTRQVFDAATFAVMRTGARFINVGRGELVDEQALIAALRSGHLGGAGLDVFATEPLPEDSPLWEIDNVIVTPHNSGSSTTSNVRSEAIFLDNLERWASGNPLKNMVV